MCLAVSGRILAIEADPADDPLWRQAEVDFGGVRQRVSLACLPDARVGDRVLVHVGLALSLVDEHEHEHEPADSARDEDAAGAAAGAAHPLADRQISDRAPPHPDTRADQPLIAPSNRLAGQETNP